ncbi:epsin-3 [Trichomonascus vanleenenianus]|uniref:Ent5p n=1 Tax=Trichomonascus vanleenenianus TaxID=2268995 RepID=UPI003ECABF2B
MDNLQKKLANISLYDVKAYVRKAQNVVMNYTEMEAKVREATNNEPWGASSTLMQEIANGTNSYSHFHEIMPMIYKRFTEKSAEEWRQIYKALQLLEFLVKNGSERVVDYARSHQAVIDMLKHFHYIDANGKDQGINIRNRAKELTELLEDVSKIRTERKKARANKTKYQGMGNVGFDDEDHYGGFGNESLEFGAGGYKGRVFGDGGGFNGSNYSGPGYSNDDEFEEYHIDDEDEEDRRTPPRAAASTSSAPVPPRKAEPVKDIISFDDDDEFGEPQAAPPPPQAQKPVSAAPADDDDEFDDFQSATPTTTQPASTKDQITSLFSQPPSFQQPQQQQQRQQPMAAAAPLAGFNAGASNTRGFSAAKPSQPQQPAKKSGDAFSSLWSSAASTSSTAAAKPKVDSSKASLSSLAQQKNEQSMWGASSGSQQQGSSSNVDDLLSF